MQKIANAVPKSTQPGRLSGRLISTPRGSVPASLGELFPKGYMVADLVTSRSNIITFRDTEPEERWTPKSAFEPADSSADSPAEAETLFAAECGRRVHIFQKWCALLQRQLRWQVHLHLLQGCELLETKSGDLQEYELFQRSNLHQLECKYFGSPTQSVANFVSISDESDTPTMPEGHPTFGPIKPTPTVQCSEDIALIPGSGNALSNVSGEPPTISEDFSPKSPADDIVTKSPLMCPP